MDDLPSFGRMLRDYRKAHDLTQEALSEQASCSIETIKKIEAGKLRPGKQLAELLANLLTSTPKDREEFIKAARNARPMNYSPSSMRSLSPLAPSSITTERQGNLLKDYELHDVIGRGSFGVVYRATQPHLARAVAIKVILPEYANHPDFIRRFETEAQFVAHLEHPHIVPLYDYWREPDGAYLVMRYMPGGNLNTVLQNGPLTLEMATRILDQLSAALTVTHRAGVIHRDLKPSNILLDTDGNAYLADFGIAKVHGASTPDGATLPKAISSSPAYLSPEQIRDEPLTPQSDLYSLGLVLFELLTGQLPFSQVPQGDLLQKQLSDPLPALEFWRPDLPSALNTVILSRPD